MSKTVKEAFETKGFKEDSEGFLFIDPESQDQYRVSNNGLVPSDFDQPVTGLLISKDGEFYDLIEFPSARDFIDQWEFELLTNKDDHQ